MNNKESIREIAQLLREKANLMEAFSAGIFEIKIDLKYRAEWSSNEEGHVEHYITRQDELFDIDSNEIVWRLLNRRMILIDDRLSKLGVKFETVVGE